VIDTSVPEGARAEVCVRNDHGAEVARTGQPLARGRPAPVPLDIRAWPEGVAHSLEVTIRDAQGEKIGARTFSVTRPPRPGWLGTKAGLTDTPVPPFTPVRVQGDAFACLLKDYAFAGRALPASIRSEGHELLAGPVRFELRVGDTTADLAAQPIRVNQRSAEPRRVGGGGPPASRA